MEGSRMPSRCDGELARRREMWRIARGLDDPREEARRYARMDERVREEIGDIHGAFAAMEKACGFSRKVPPGRRVSFRLEGGKLVRNTEEEVEPPSRGGVGESSSSSVAAVAASGSEDELCSAFGSSARV